MIEISGIVETYMKTDSIRATAKELGISHQVVRKALVTAGIAVTERTAQIMQLYRKGKSVKEIADILHCSTTTVHTHIPYSKCSYTVGQKSKNAIRISEWRKSKIDNEVKR